MDRTAGPAPASAVAAAAAVADVGSHAHMQPAAASQQPSTPPKPKPRRPRKSSAAASKSAASSSDQPQQLPQQPTHEPAQHHPQPQPQQAPVSINKHDHCPKPDSDKPGPPKSKHKPKHHLNHPAPENHMPTAPHPQTQPSKKKHVKKAEHQTAASSQTDPPKHPPNASKIYEPYFDPATVASGLESGIFVRGVLRSNPKNHNDAYAALNESPNAAALRLHPELAAYDVGSGSDIYICGEIHRNRALNGDVVAIRILNQREAQHSYRAHRQKDDKIYDRRRAKDQRRLDRMANKLACLASTSPSPALAPTSDTAISPDKVRSRIPEVFGTVVAILAQNENRTFIGKLGYNAPPEIKRYPLFAKSLSESTVWFKPSSQTVRYMILDAHDLPQELRSINPRLTCSVSVDSWNACDLYPTAKFGGIVGKRGSIDVETQIILEENNVCTDPFSQSVLQCLPKSPWSIPATEITRRTDLRTECIFTIDPPTARDLDDAVSCKPLPNGNVMIGVHIADVSYFVRPDTPLDLQARQRATTTYMVQMAIPMLPSLLCEDLCSLNPGVDRLAFSVMWEMNPDTAEVVSTWFGRTVINSACKLSYDDAQSIIDGAAFPKSVAHYQTSSSGQLSAASPERVKEIEKSIFWFYDLSVKMRKRRFDSGALSLSSVKLSFDLDPSGNPTSCQPYPIKDSNRLIE
ncbi:hypothetical protein LPJ53_004164, partial [Coemansia erecta]